MKNRILLLASLLLLPALCFAADTAVETATLSVTDLDNSMWGPYWSDKDTGVIIFVNSSTDLTFRRTTDAGVTWSAQNVIEAGTVEHVACVPSNQRSGGTAGTVHCAWLESTTNLKYVPIDISAGTAGTIRTASSSLTVGTSGNLLRVSITETANGNLLIAGSTQANTFAYRSTDSGANWTSVTSPMESATEEDFLLLFPANTADGADATAIFQDRSENLLSVKMYDDSANTWTETAMSNTTGDPIVESATYYNIDGTVRHSDGKLLICAHQNDVASLDDIYTWEITADSIASPTVTNKADVLTNTVESSQCAIIINQQNNDVYVGYLIGGTWAASVDARYKLSTDDMATWGSETAYSEAAADDLKLIQGPRSIGNEGGRMMFTFFNDDLNDIFVNLTNDIEIAAAAVGGTRRIFFVD